MLEPPDLKKEEIINGLKEHFGVDVVQCDFLPLGADVNTAVFRVAAVNRAVYFLKLRKGEFNEIVVRVPHFLYESGIAAIIAPILTRNHQLWCKFAAFTAILYPFIEGKDGYEMKLTEHQWLEFGRAMHSIHSVHLPTSLSHAIPKETFSSRWRDMTRVYQTQAEECTFTDPVAVKMAAFMRGKRAGITQAVERAVSLADELREQPLEFVLCHSDIHPGNLHITPDGALYIVDWDDPIFAPRERDLLLIGGCSTWKDPTEETWFYQGYGEVEINGMAMTYYRYERLIADIAVISQMIFSSNEGGADRETHLDFFTSIFLPGHELDLAAQADSWLGKM
jgi:spectinomycin phosphotransferase